MEKIINKELNKYWRGETKEGVLLEVPMDIGKTIAKKIRAKKKNSNPK